MATEIDKCPIFIDKRQTPMQRDFASNLAAEKRGCAIFFLRNLVDG